MPKGIYIHKHAFWKGKKLPYYIRKKMSESRKGYVMPKKQKEKISESHRQEKHWNWQGGRKNTCVDCKMILTNFGIKRCRKCNSIYKSGKNNQNWKGGISKDKSRYKRKRRNLKLKAEGHHNFGEWALLKKQYGYICPCCKRKEPEIKLTEDHIIPLSKGGSDFIENIQPLCRSCNSKKYISIVKF